MKFDAKRNAIIVDHTTPAHEIIEAERTSEHFVIITPPRYGHPDELIDYVDSHLFDAFKDSKRDWAEYRIAIQNLDPTSICSIFYLHHLLTGARKKRLMISASKPALDGPAKGEMLRLSRLDETQIISGSDQILGWFVTKRGFFETLWRAKPKKLLYRLDLQGWHFVKASV